MNIVITGASQGIGYELVKKLSVDPGHRLLAISRNVNALNDLQKLCREMSGNEIIIEGIDLADEMFPGRMKSLLDKRMPVVDILVNNAGQLINKPFEELSVEDFDSMFNVNVKGVFLLVKMMLGYFNRPAHIVNIGSMGGYQGSTKFPGLSLYSASKGALATLTECMAEEFREMDIRANCLALGSAQTEMLGRAFPEFKAPVTAGEMAGFIAGFCLEGHHFFNGKILPVAVTTP